MAGPAGCGAGNTYIRAMPVDSRTTTMTINVRRPYGATKGPVSHDRNIGFLPGGDRRRRVRRAVRGPVAATGAGPGDPYPWLFIHISFLTGFRNRVGAIMSWWLAFARDLRRERTFTVDDTPVPSGAYGDTGEPGHPR
jgi:hypothetical protein